MRLITIATSAALLATPVAAQKADRAAASATATGSASTCAKLADAVELQHKNLAYEEWATFTSSAPQATQKATEIANVLALLKLNLDLMAAQRCPMPTRPISSVTYMSSALQCATAKGEDENKVKCDRSTWKAE